MKISIIGSGAVGGLLGFYFSQTQHEVTLFDQCKQLNALKAKGITLIDLNGTHLTSRQFKAVGDFNSCEQQDLVILAVKAHQIANIAKDIQAILHDKTIVITLQNGIPWWYFKKLDSQYNNIDFNCLDPDGNISKYISSERIIGCIAYCAAEIKEPGVIQHTEGIRFPLGELDGKSSPRIKQVAEIFTNAGFKSPIISDIRAEIWLKAWGSLAFNPISALTHSTLAEICNYPLSRELVKNMMLEAESIANELGIKFRVPMEKRINGAQKVGHHKTSMLQDVESGLELEIEAILGSIVELAQITKTSAPYTSAIYACTKLLNKNITDNFIHTEALS